MRRTESPTNPSVDIQDLMSRVPVLEFLTLHPVPHVVAMDRRFVYINPAAVTLFDAQEPADLLGRDITTLIHPLDHGRILTRIETLDEIHSANTPAITRIQTLTGRTKRIISSSMSLAVGNLQLVVASGTEITSRYHRAILEADRNFQRLFENMHDVFYRTDSDHRLTLVGPAVTKMLGYLPEEVIGLPAADFYVHPEKRAEVVNLIKSRGEIKDRPALLRHKLGHGVHVSVSSKAIYDREGMVIGMEGVFRDVTEQVKSKEQLQQLATTDELTGILNRRAFLDRAERVVKRLRRTPESCLFLIMDLDRFKVINDQHGHLSGDRMLKKFVQVILANLREIDIFGRLGGDEFAVILTNCPLDQGTNLFERILQELEKASVPLTGAVRASISTSIGVTQLSPEDLPLSLALARADRALYQAKEDGGGCFRFHMATGDGLVALDS